MKNEKKSYYRICMWGDEDPDGYLLLTQEEANIIQKAMDFNNWVHLEVGDGSFGVNFDANNSLTEKEMEADYTKRYDWIKKFEKPSSSISCDLDVEDDDYYTPYYEPRSDWARENEDDEYYSLREYGLL